MPWHTNFVCLDPSNDISENYVLD